MERANRFRLFIDGILFRRGASEKKQKSVPFSELKPLILKYRKSGIPRELMPQSFSVDGLLNVFQEMLPVTNGEIDEKIYPDAAEIANAGLEVARLIITDESGEHMLFHRRNVGESKKIEGGVMTRLPLRRELLSREIGWLHTHPTDVMPSSRDILGLISGLFSIGFVVTPARVVALFRSDKTIHFSPIVGEGYLVAMGKAKGKLNVKNRFWTTDYQDLKDLDILCYEARRGERTFVSK